jgi:hAT family C-terminal dimerisation region
MISPTNARQPNPPTLRMLFLRFPNLNDWCDRNTAEIEWRAQSLLSLEEIRSLSEDSVQNMNPIEYWNMIFKLKVNQVSRFPNLEIVVSFLLSMPYSNAAAERSFSSLKLNKTQLRNSMKNETLVSLMRMRSWLNKENKTAANISFPEWLINRVLKVRANKQVSKDT